jgi:hypothetical protein
VSQSFRRFLTRHVACPLNDWRKGVAGRQWREFEAADRMTRDQVLALQEARLRDFLRWAGAQSPFYERVFRETGFDPDAPDVRAELRKIPPIDKKTVREHREEMLPREYAARPCRRGAGARQRVDGGPEAAAVGSRVLRLHDPSAVLADLGGARTEGPGDRAALSAQGENGNARVSKKNNDPEEVQDARRTIE